IHATNGVVEVVRVVGVETHVDCGTVEKIEGLLILGCCDCLRGGLALNTLVDNSTFPSCRWNWAARLQLFHQGTQLAHPRPQLRYPLLQLLSSIRLRRHGFVLQCRLGMERHRSEERRVGKECRSRWSRCH